MLFLVLKQVYCDSARDGLTWIGRASKSARRAMVGLPLPIVALIPVGLPTG